MIRTVCGECGEVLKEKDSPVEFEKVGLCPNCKRAKLREAGVPPASRKHFQKSVVLPEEALSKIRAKAKKAGKSLSAWCRWAILKQLDDVEDTIRAKAVAANE